RFEAPATRTPAALPEITLPAAEAVPPIVLLVAPESSWMPPNALLRARVPERSVPIQLPAISVPDVPLTNTPPEPPPLLEMKVRAPALVPPMTLPVPAALTSTPWKVFVAATVPVESRPMMFPATAFEAEPAPRIQTPRCELPEMMLPNRVPGVVVRPPM